MKYAIWHFLARLSRAAIDNDFFPEPLRTWIDVDHWFRRRWSRIIPVRTYEQQWEMWMSILVKVRALRYDRGTPTWWHQQRGLIFRLENQIRGLCR
jgi:hypothetical protein